jgi:hypothetical protein
MLILAARNGQGTPPVTFAPRVPRLLLAWASIRAGKRNRRQRAIGNNGMAGRRRPVRATWPWAPKSWCGTPVCARRNDGSGAALFAANDHQQLVRPHERDRRPRPHNRTKDALAQAAGDIRSATMGFLVQSPLGHFRNTNAGERRSRRCIVSPCGKSPWPESGPPGSPAGQAAGCPPAMRRAATALKSPSCCGVRR